MNYPITTPIQLRSVLRALRQSRDLSQAQVGQLLGVNQKRIAAIENSPGVTSVDQITRLVATLGGRLLIEVTDAQPTAATLAASKGTSRKAAAPTKSRNQDNW